MESIICLDTARDAYAIQNCYQTMTVGQLIDLLSQYDEDSPVVFRNDKGYTYVNITEQSFEEVYPENYDSLEH